MQVIPELRCFVEKFKLDVKREREMGSNAAPHWHHSMWTLGWRSKRWIAIDRRTLCDFIVVAAVDNSDADEYDAVAELHIHVAACMLCLCLWTYKGLV